MNKRKKGGKEGRRERREGRREGWTGREWEGKRSLTPLHLFSDGFYSSGLLDASSAPNSMPLSEFISAQVDKQEIKRKTKYLDCEYTFLSSNAGTISPKFSTEGLCLFWDEPLFFLPLKLIPNPLQSVLSHYPKDFCCLACCHPHCLALMEKRDNSNQIAIKSRKERKAFLYF